MESMDCDCDCSCFQIRYILTPERHSTICVNSNILQGGKQYGLQDKWPFNAKGSANKGTLCLFQLKARSHWTIVTTISLIATNDTMTVTSYADHYNKQKQIAVAIRTV